MRSWTCCARRASCRCAQPSGTGTPPTQNQALAALLFLYRIVLERDVPWLDDLVRAKRPGRLPVAEWRGMSYLGSKR